MVRDAQMYAEELGVKSVDLQHPLPSGSTDEGESIEERKIGPWVNEVVLNMRYENIRQQRWQDGKMKIWIKSAFRGCRSGRWSRRTQ